MTTDEPDPMAALVEALDTHSKPHLGWVVQWSAGHTREPVGAAWEASRDPSAMLTYLVLICGWEWARSLSLKLFGMSAQAERLASGRRGIRVYPEHGSPPLEYGAALVRGAVPWPPTLTDALASIDLPEVPA